MDVKISKQEHKYLMLQLKKMEEYRRSGKVEKVPHLSESTKVALNLVGY